MIRVLQLACAILSVYADRKVGITMTKSLSKTFAVAHHAYSLYEAIEKLEGWQPLLIMGDNEWDGHAELDAFGRTWKQRPISNIGDLTIGIASCAHAMFSKQTVSIVHNQGSTYFDMLKLMRKNKSHAFDANYRYDVLWSLPHHAWFSSFLLERNRFHSKRTVPYFWSPRFLTNNSEPYTYQTGSASRVGIYETNRGVYKTSVIPLFVLNRAYRHNHSLIHYAEAYGLGPIANEVLMAEIQALEIQKDGLLVSRARKQDIPGSFHKTQVGTILSHQHMVGINNLYLEALYMNMSLVHNSQYFRECGYYYRGFDVEDASVVLAHAIQHHDTTIEEYARRAQKCLWSHSIENPGNLKALKEALEEALAFSNHDDLMMRFEV